MVKSKCNIILTQKVMSMNEKRFYYDILSEFKTNRSGVKTTFIPPEAELGKGRVPYGFDSINTSAADVYGWYGFRFVMHTTAADTDVTVTVKVADGLVLSRRLTLPTAGEHSFDCRLQDFDIESAKPHVWHELHSVTVDTRAEIVVAKLVRGRVIAAVCDVKGKSGEVGDTLSYTVRVYNCSDATQSVVAEQIFDGWESIIYGIAPSAATILSFGEAEFTVTGEIHDYMVRGAHEKGTVRFTPSGDGASAVTVDVYSMRAVIHPLIYHTSEEWEKTAEKIDNYEKFKPEYERMKLVADGWEPNPPVPLGERDYCYDTWVEEPLVFTAYMYALTRDERYAEKATRFMEYFSNGTDGYPVKKKGCSQSYVQEGHFIAHIALAYDLIYNSPSVANGLKQSMTECFRIYCDILDRNLASGHISNWVLSELSGALYCSVMLGDYERIDRFVFGPTGIIEQLRYGAFDDGWWYECSISYNTWVSSIMLHTAHLMRRYGVDLINASFPIPYNKQVRASHPSRPTEVRFAMVNQKWGGIRRGYIRIKDLFDAPIRFVDYKGVMFGVNDSDEKKLGGMHLGSTYDLAYHYYRDPLYISIIKNDPSPDPIFGIAELPDTADGSEPYRESAYSDNIGLLMLRSRVKGREAREEIQAILRYGSHGFAHGHFDRTEMLSLMRYGKSVYNPEHVWWGYGHLMYKFYVQSSATKNMVTVDGKMQLPSDSERTLFSCNDGFSAGAVRTTAVWAYPPFGGMVYDTGRNLHEQVEYNVADLSSITAAPHGEVTEPTEPIRQSRAMAVTDDYVVMFDHLCGEREHDYDCLYQLGSLSSITASGEVLHIGHRAQKTTDPKSDAQFITNCDFYKTTGEVKASFSVRFGDEADLRGARFGHCEPGELITDVYTAWPRENTVSVGLVAADMGVRIPYNMTVTADGDKIISYHANAWILGTRQLDCELSGQKKLTFDIENLPVYNEQLYPYRSSQGLFLADAVIEYDDGECVRVADMAILRENIDEGHGIGRDYMDGEVLITGVTYSDAIPISPADHEKHGSLTVDIGCDGKRAVRLTAVVGACAFPGDKTQRRVTYGIAQRGVAARYVTVIEPHEGDAAVRSVRGIDKNTVEVTLRCGAVEVVHIDGIEDGAPTVTVTRA